MAKQIEKITSQEVDFAKWYTDVVINAGLIDYGPVKGTMIFKPYGFAIWENIQKILDPEFKKAGVDNVYFPLLIPSSLFNREKDHIEGFAPEVATVTKVGDTVLSEELYIRPTSEVLFMNHFQKEIKSYRDLPLRYNQWTNVLRWEKTTRPFLRSSEFLWQEGHTVHETPEEAKAMTLQILDIYKNFAETSLRLPVISGRKTEREKFAGAKETYTIESMMHDGQSLQAGTSHYFGDNFTRAFNIKFQSKEQKEEYANSSSWGVSTRLIGAIIMTHSDDFGLVLPSGIAPIQVQIIKIKETDEVNNVTNKIKEQLYDLKVGIDDSDKSFGFKISEAEIKGIPLRIEIGPRDLENGEVTISRRDLRTKESIKIENVNSYIREQLEAYDKNLFNLALKNREDRTYTANTFEEYKQILDTKQGYVLVPFCGEIDCENKIKEETQTVSRCIPDGVEQTPGKCFHCGSDSKLRVYFGRAY